MPRDYKRKPGSWQYKNYTEESLLQAINDTKYNDVRTVAKNYNIPYRTLYNKIRRKHTKSCGGQTVLTSDEENELSEYLITCADYGMPLEKNDIKLVVSSYLNKKGQTTNKFKNNIPSNEWVSSFIKRNAALSNRMCQNIKRARAELKPDDIRKYFGNLKNTLEGVPASHILNFDKTNLSDDPGVKKFVFRRGIKYPERIINYSKGNISVMFAGTADGKLLPPYVIYKSQHMYESWCSGGPEGTRFNQSKSGWMDGICFEDWFVTLVIPWARRLEGTKVIIGHNLSSHLNDVVIKKCTEHNIHFVLLPPNSTDKCQPLDVAFFAPMKREWRNIMEKFKLKKNSLKIIG